MARHAALAAALARVWIELRGSRVWIELRGNSINRILVCALRCIVVWCWVLERGFESEPMAHALAAADLAVLEPDAAGCRCYLENCRALGGRIFHTQNLP